MAEGLMKQMYGQRAYVQSAGVRNDMEIDGFSVAVCQELGIELSRHRSRSFDEMQDWGDDLSQFDLIVALSPASQRQALELTRFNHLEVEYWPILDPTGLGESREAKLAAYRQARDQIRTRMLDRFGPPTVVPGSRQTALPPPRRRDFCHDHAAVMHSRPLRCNALIFRRVLQDNRCRPPVPGAPERWRIGPEPSRPAPRRGGFGAIVPGILGADGAEILKIR